MKIEGTPRNTPLTRNVQTAAHPKPAGSGAGSKDSVSLSAKSSQLQSLEAAIQESPDVDIEKIEAIKKAIVEGNFSISSGRVAEKMLASARELLTQQNA